jgi:hypothetical protein
LRTDFGPIHMLTVDSNTLCTADIEQWKLVTIGVGWVLTASFVLWTLRSDFWRISKLKTHIAKALAVTGNSTDIGRCNDIAESVGTFCVGDDFEVHILMIQRNDDGTCEM